MRGRGEQQESAGLGWPGFGRLSALLASTSVAALLIGGGGSAMAATCTQITPSTEAASGGAYGSATGLCVTTSFTGNIGTFGNISPSGISFTNGTMTGEIFQVAGTIVGGITLDSHSAIIGASQTAAIFLQSPAGFSGSISNAGTIASTNTRGIYIKNIPNFSGSISNSGTISGGQYGIQISTVTQFGSGSIGGGITNSGTIAGRSAAISLRRLTNFSGGISNSGIIAGGAGIIVGGTNAVGAITNFSGGISNSGTISGSRGIFVQTVSTFSGGISNSGTILAGNTGIGVFTHDTFSGGISNSGTISAVGIGIRVSSANFIGGTSAGGGITNSGTIIAGVDGISDAGATTTGGISNSGTISVSGGGPIFGVFVGTNGILPTFLGGISNSGAISVSGGSQNFGILVGSFAYGGSATIPVFDGGISNSGTISVSGGQSYGIFVGGLYVVHPISIPTFGGGISNSGTISAADAAIVVGAISNGSSVSISNFSGGISNSGTIVAGGTGIVVGGSGVTISTFSGNIANSGQITGATGITVGAGVTFAPGSAIINTGTIIGATAAIDASHATRPVTIDQAGGLISGAIKLSDFGDTLNFTGGTINGSIIGQGNGTVNFSLVSGTYGGNPDYAITDVGALNVNSGIIILDATSNSATTVIVNGGTLQVGDAANPGASLTASNGVNVYGTLAGHGTVDANVAIENGGTLSPGGSIGVLTINGNLNLAPNSNYAVEFAPTQSSRTQVNGSVTLGGASVTGVVTSNQYGLYRGGQTYAILSDTAGGIGGTNQFNPNVSLTSATPSERVVALSLASLSYDSNDVYLTSPTYAVVLAVAPNASFNAQNVAGGINNAILSGVTVPSGFQNLANLSGNALNTAVNQLGGQPGGGAVTTGFMAGNMFLNMVLDPFVDGRDNGFGPGTINAIASNESATPIMAAPALAYADDSVTARANAAFQAVWPVHKGPPDFRPQLTLWGGSYGGVGSITGNAVTGAAATQSQIFGIVAGLDDHIAPDTMIGFALGGGGTSWQLNQALGSGHAGMAQASIYGSKHYGPAYVSGALAYSWQGVTTNRVVTLAGSDTLSADFGANVISSRLEVGYRLPSSFLPMSGLPTSFALTPYAAAQAQGMFLPAYAEYAGAGSNQFALTYATRDYSTVRTELGSWFDSDLVVAALPFTKTGALKIYGRAAWAHDFNNESTAISFFQTLPGSSFLINTAKPAADSALVTAGLEYKLADGWSVLGKFDGEYSSTTSIYAGTGVLRKVW